MLCVIFDLAVAMAYNHENFIKVIYHDGVLESMADTKKITFLDKIYSITNKYKIQYIITTLTDHIPRDSNGKQFEFKREEIILELDDKPDNSGRLFSQKFW